MTLKDVMNPNQAIVYDKNNALQFDGALKLLDNIKRDMVDDDRLSLVVDVGCGTGNVTFHFAQSLKPVELIGFDLNPKMVEFCLQKKKPVELQNTKISFKQASFEDPKLLASLNIQSNTADLVYSVYVFHWLKDKVQGLRNVYEMLRPGGHSYIVSSVDTELTLYRHRRLMESDWAQYFPSDYQPFAQRAYPDMPDIRRPGSVCGLSMVPKMQEMVYYFENLLLTANIPNAKVEALSLVYTFDSVDAFVDMAIPVISEYSYLPDDEKFREKYRKNYREWIHDYYKPKYPNGGPIQHQLHSVFIKFQKPKQL